MSNANSNPSSDASTAPAPAPTPITITPAQIQQEMDAAKKQVLLKYYYVDDTDPFHPQFKPRPGVTVSLPPGELQQLGLGLDIANSITLGNRRRDYARMREKRPNLKPIVSAGDSWFLHPLLKDVINHLIDGHGYAIYSVDAAGAELSEVVTDRRWSDALKSEGAKTLLISGGGNDLMGGRFGEYLNTYTPDNGTGSARLLNAKFEEALNRVLNHYRAIMERVQNGHPGVKVLTHAYDYALPRAKGKWLGKAMIASGLTDIAEQRACIRHVLDRFTTGLKRICNNEYPNIARHIERSNLVGEFQWDDEIHPTDEGFAVVASNFKAAFNSHGITP